MSPPSLNIKAKKDEVSNFVTNCLLDIKAEGVAICFNETHINMLREKLGQKGKYEIVKIKKEIIDEYAYYYVYARKIAR